MVGRPRRDIIDEENVGIYHCWNRCGRGSPLCGIDPVTGENREHRKEWIQRLVETLGRCFGIDACVYSILPNHYHLIARNRPDLVENWSDQEVARRWWWLCPERRADNGDAVAPLDIEIASIAADKPRIVELRRRLSSISWFMKFLGERIAKRANAEDQVYGHFWAGRFDCRNLLDEGAVLACSVYVDLNEVRARLAETPEESKYSSVYQRALAQLKRHQRAAECGDESFLEFDPEDPDFWLCPLHESDASPILEPNQSDQSADVPAESQANAAASPRHWRTGFLPIRVDEYLRILDWTGRNLIHAGRGAIDAKLAPILERVGLNPERWLELIEGFPDFHSAIGNSGAMAIHAAQTGRQWLHGVARSREFFQ